VLASVINPSTFRTSIHKVGAVADAHLGHYKSSDSLNYAFSFGAMAGILLVIMIVSGTFLAMHYIPDMDLAFDQVDHIMTDVFEAQQQIG